MILKSVAMARLGHAYKFDARHMNRWPRLSAYLLDNLPKFWLCVLNPRSALPIGGSGSAIKDDVRRLGKDLDLDLVQVFILEI